MLGSNKVYIKKGNRNLRKVFRFFGLGICLAGLIFLVYFSLPLISWQLYLEPAFAAQQLASPIPQTTILSSTSIKSLINNTATALSGTDYTNASNWFPSAKTTKKAEESQDEITSQVASYYLSVPKLGIQNAVVSTVNGDLKENLVNYDGTAIPPEKGNAVIFGHSTLPQLYNPKDYTTIFANILKMQVGDTFLVTINNVEYTYKIFDIQVVDPTDTQVLAQTYDDSYLTVITCTPPGTVWKRLVLRSRLEKLASPKATPGASSN